VRPEFHRRARPPVMHDGLPERIRVGAEEALAPQASGGRPGRPGLSGRLHLAGARRGLRRRLVANGEGKPYQVWQPLVDQGHFPPRLALIAADVSVTVLLLLGRRQRNSWGSPESGDDGSPG
jgi:hypothetical protein